MPAISASQSRPVTMPGVFDEIPEAEREAGWPPPLASDRRPLVWQSVHGIYHALRIRLRIALADLLLEASEALVLVYLHSSPGCSPGEVRRALGFHRSTLASILTRLERRGYIKRGAPPFDGRRLMLDVTASGQVAAEMARDVLRDIEDELDGWVAPHERRGAEAVFAACQAMLPPEDGYPD